MSETLRHWQKKISRKLVSLAKHGPRLAWHRYQTRKLHSLSEDAGQLQAAGFFSQFGQDRYVAEVLFPEKHDGFFVDIGAHDGVSGSNSCYFERNRGWRGVCVEPIPEIFEQLKANRKCDTVCGCIAAENGTAKFIRVTGPCEMLSGLDINTPPEHREWVRSEVARHGGTVNEFDVSCLRFNDLIARYQIPQIDYLTIDTEGAELAILQTIDFRACRIQVLDLENNYHGDHLIEWLDPLGYELAAMVGCDEIYVLRGSEAHVRIRSG
jgi:FkbM family methyltransferase